MKPYIQELLKQNHRSIRVNIYRITSYRMELCDIKIYNYHNEEFMERNENI